MQDGINQTRILIDHSTFDQVRCGEGLKMLELYTKKYDKKRGIYLKEPKHDENCLAGETEIRTLNGWVSMKELEGLLKPSYEYLESLL